jgi:hypothetical protein
MNEVDFVWCFVLCALAVWVESLRSVRAMRKQAEEYRAGYESHIRRSRHDLPDGQMEQETAWTELSAPNGLLKSGKSGALMGSVSKLDISLNTPWLYLSLGLMFWLLLL